MRTVGHAHRGPHGHCRTYVYVGAYAKLHNAAARGRTRQKVKRARAPTRTVTGCRLVVAPAWKSTPTRDYTTPAAVMYRNATTCAADAAASDKPEPSPSWTSPCPASIAIRHTPRRSGQLPPRSAIAKPRRRRRRRRSRYAPIGRTTADHHGLARMRAWPLARMCVRRRSRTGEMRRRDENAQRTRRRTTAQPRQRPAPPRRMPEPWP